VIKTIIQELNKLSGNDLELYCNLALQITLQMKYDSERTKNINKELEIPIRNPLKVLIDFKCICEEGASSRTL